MNNIYSPYKHLPVVDGLVEGQVLSSDLFYKKVNSYNP